MSTGAIIGISLGTVVVLTLLFHFLEDHRRTVAFLGTGIGIAGAVASVALGSMELQKTADSYALSVEQHAALLHLNQQRVAFELAEDFNRLPLDHAKGLLGTVASKPPEEIQRLFNEDRDHWEACRDILNFFEQASLAIKVGFADETSACALLEGPAVAFYSRLQPWIDYHRTGLNKEGVWEQYQWLHDRWQDGCPETKGERASPGA